jgi:hypothetical protein
MPDSHARWAHDVSESSDTATRRVGLGRDAYDESRSEDRAIVVARGRAEFRFTGHAVGVVVSGTAPPNVVVRVPADPVEQAAAFGTVVSAMLAGGWIGGLVHDPVIGAFAGGWAGARLWNRWRGQRGPQ